MFLQKLSRLRALFSVGRLLVSVTGVIVVVGAALLMAPSSTAFAVVVRSADGGSVEGPGRVCVFFAPSGGNGWGHVGWAFQVGQQDNWVFGATEGTGSPNIPRGNYNGAWVRHGKFKPNPGSVKGIDVTGADTVIGDFVLRLANGSKDNGGYYHPADYYQSYRCKATTTSAISLASQVAQGIKDQGYSIPDNDCLADAIRVLSVYDSSLQLSPPPGLIDPPDPYAGPLGGAAQQMTPEWWFDAALPFVGFDNPAIGLPSSKQLQA